LLVVADDERDQVAAEQDQQRDADPQARLPALVEIVAARPHDGSLCRGEPGRDSRNGDEAWLSGRLERTRRRVTERRAGGVAGEGAQPRAAEVAITAGCFSTLAHIPSCSCLVPSGLGHCCDQVK